MKNQFRHVCAGFIESNEGRQHRVYDDILGVPNIGVGFNLLRSDAPKRTADLGVDYEELRAGVASLNDKQIDKLLLDAVESSISCCRSYYEDFDSIDEPRKVVLVDMAFNLGPERLLGFRKFRDCINKRNYKGAKDEMIDSLYYKQVENRARRNADIIATGEVVLLGP